MTARLLRAGICGATLVICAASVAAQPPVATPSPSPPTASSAGPNAIEGAIVVGGMGAGTSGSQVRVGEYDDLEDGALARTGLQFWGSRGATRFELLASHTGRSSDRRYSADLEINRLVRAHVSYQRMPRRLDHDPLTYVDASSNIGGTFLVSHTDTDPFATYGFDYGELVSRLELALPNAPALRFYVSHRGQTREGTRQSLAISHCSSCHVVSYSRAMDQRTSDRAGGIKLLTSRVSVDYSVQAREFSESGGGLSHTYGRAVHPVTLQEVFLNRVQFDERSGALPFDTTPGLDRTSHVLKARVALPAQATLSGKLTRSETRNTDTGLNTRYVGGSGRFVVPLGRSVTVRGAVRHYDIESDSVFIDVLEPVAPAGPTAGLTYSQAYPTFGTPDFVRESSLSRSPTEFSLDVAWKPMRRTTLKAGYGWEQIRRDHFDVERTTTNSLVLTGRGVIRKGLQWRTRFDHDWTNDPFMYEKAAIPAVLQPFASPGNLPFTGLQYYEMYSARQADLTAYPTRAGRFDQLLSWMPSPRVSLSAHYRWRGASNHDLNFSSWNRSAHAPGAEIWLAPGERWTLTAGYSYERERLETMFTTLAFSG